LGPGQRAGQPAGRPRRIDAVVGRHDLPPVSATGEPLRRVGAYETYDLQVRYTGIKPVALRGGIRNLFDRPPPYSNAGGQTGFQGGYDNTYGDPQGRFVYAGVSYEFK
jgi:iron complex outermembrane recepter protein